MSVDGIASVTPAVHMAPDEPIRMLRVACHKLLGLWVHCPIVDQTMIRQRGAMPQLLATTVRGAFDGVQPPESDVAEVPELN